MKRILIGGLYPDTPFVLGKTINYSNLLSQICEVVLETSRDSSNFDLFVSIDFKKSDIEFARRCGITRERSLLIRQEPRVVWPANYSKKSEKFFGTVIDIGKLQSKHPFQHWPQDTELNWKVLTSAPRNTKNVVIMNSNRCSVIKGELYSLRKLAAKKLPEVILFGRDWEISSLKRVRLAISASKLALSSKTIPSFYSLRTWFSSLPKSNGAVLDKEETLSNFMYALVIENESTYVSEKIFDCFRAGCIPIYVGPDINEYDIPNSLYVRATPNLNSITEAISQLSKIDIEIWRNELVDWLTKPSTQERWSYLNYAENIKKYINTLLSD